MSDTVYICYEWQPPEAKPGNHYHKTGEWVVAGIVEKEKDANLWMEPATSCQDTSEKDRKIEEATLNVVESFYTKNLD